MALTSAERTARWRAKNLDKTRAYSRKWKENNPQRAAESNKANMRNRRLMGQQLIREHKNVPCTDCGLRYPTYVMDFDHRRGEKLANVGSLVGHANARRIREEIAKCEVVCANCHRERTYGPCA